MSVQNFKSRLRQGNLLVGSLMGLPSPEAAEVMSLAGFDYLWVELEHGSTDWTTAGRMIQAVGGRCPCVVRTPSIDEVMIKKTLDLGCEGIVLPQIKTAAQAAAAVSFCRYPPLGTRSVGIARAQGYGMFFGDYVAHANEQLAVIAQIEHIDAVNDIEAIAAVEGIDAALIGPYDLSGSLGITGEINHPLVQNAIQKVEQTMKRAGIPLGIFTLDAPTALGWIGRGFTLIALGEDTVFLGQAALQARRAIKP